MNVSTKNTHQSLPRTPDSEEESRTNLPDSDAISDSALNTFVSLAVHTHYADLGCVHEKEDSSGGFEAAAERLRTLGISASAIEAARRETFELDSVIKHAITRMGTDVSARSIESWALAIMEKNLSRIMQDKIESFTRSDQMNYLGVDISVPITELWQMKGRPESQGIFGYRRAASWAKERPLAEIYYIDGYFPELNFQGPRQLVITFFDDHTFNLNAGSISSIKQLIDFACPNVQLVVERAQYTPPPPRSFLDALRDGILAWCAP